MIDIRIEKNNQLVVNGELIFANIHLHQGEITQLHGANGIGKSTLLQYLKYKQNELLENETCQFLDQGRLSPLNQVSFSDLKIILKQHRREELLICERVEACLKGYEDLPINELSGGQNQMVKICLSLYLSGSVFFFDEPFQFLDRKNQLIFEDVLRELKTLQKKILIIEHQRDISKMVSHRCEIEVCS